MMNWLWGKACSSFAEEVHGPHGFSDCPYCFKRNMDIGAESLSFSDYLITNLSIHIQEYLWHENGQSLHL
jgi:hypothetical protein